MPTLESFRKFIFRRWSSVPSWERSISSLHMPERFSQDARMVSFLAHEHAFRRHHNCVSTDHLLLVLLDDQRVVTLLQKSGANLDFVRQGVEARILAEPESTTGDPILPVSSGLHGAWKNAHDIADRRGARPIEPEDLLLALAVRGQGPLSKTARDLVASGFGDPTGGRDAP